MCIIALVKVIQRRNQARVKNDPISQNEYAYTKNNPIIYVDPSGHVSTYITTCHKGRTYYDELA